MSKRKVIIPIFVPHKGCPHDCVFCNQRKITGCLESATVEDVRKAVLERLNTIDPEKDEIEIAFFGGSFTMIPVVEQETLLIEANRYIKEGLISDIRVSTRPDGIDEDVIERLKKYGVTVVELGIQSMEDKVLLESKRGYLSELVPSAIKLLKENGFTVGVQVMTGLPGSTKEIEVKTTELLCSCKPHIARIYPALVIKDTELERMYLEGIYKPQTVDDAVESASEMLKIFIKHNVKVIRRGLQPTDNISEGKDVIAGPFHPSMGELVESRMYRDILEAEILQKLRLKSKAEGHAWESSKLAVKALKITGLDIHCNPAMVSKLSGHKKSNKEYLKDLLEIKKIKIIDDAEDQRIYMEFWHELVEMA